VRGQHHALAAPYPRERPSTHFTGGWVGLRAGLDRCGKSDKTIPLTLMCADGAVMVVITTRLLCGPIKNYPTILFFLLNKKVLGARNGEHVTLDLHALL